MTNHISSDPDLVEIYLVSSSPVILYRKFRRNRTVQRLTQDHRAWELHARYNHFGLIEDKTIDDVVQTYIYLIALGLRPEQEARPFLQTIDAHHLNWTVPIARIMLEHPEPLVVTVPFELTSTNPQTNVEPESLLRIPNRRRAGPAFGWVWSTSGAH